jgi:hypothetical protein
MQQCVSNHDPINQEKCGWSQCYGWLFFQFFFCSFEMIIFKKIKKGKTNVGAIT